MYAVKPIVACFYIHIIIHITIDADHAANGGLTSSYMGAKEKEKEMEVELKKSYIKVCIHILIEGESNRFCPIMISSAGSCI